MSISTIDSSTESEIRAIIRDEILKIIQENQSQSNGGAAIINAFTNSAIAYATKASPTGILATFGISILSSALQGQFNTKDFSLPFPTIQHPEVFDSFLYAGAYPQTFEFNRDTNQNSDNYFPFLIRNLNGDKVSATETERNTNFIATSVFRTESEYFTVPVDNIEALKDKSLTEILTGDMNQFPESQRAMIQRFRDQYFGLLSLDAIKSADSLVGTRFENIYAQLHDNQPEQTKFIQSLAAIPADLLPPLNNLIMEVKKHGRVC